jgi:GrpB-like predicted nucleotidyltransferase (UPF0157 family)/ribosomal protein S18 acetylase RimI-like enzyme
LVDYDPGWAGRFEGEARAISGALAGLLDAPGTGVHHVGSTSIPGCAAKDTIDVLVQVPAATPPDRISAPLEALGLEHRPDFAAFLPERVFAQRPHPPLLNVHVEQVGLAGAGRDGRLVFRDALRADDRLRDAYVARKRQLAAEHHDVEAYAEAKSGFVREVLARAAAGGDHTGVHLRAEAYESDVAQRLVADYTAHLVEQVPGGFDLSSDSPPPDGAFRPPRGSFLVAYDDVAPIGCGAVWEMEPGVAELRRMWMEPEHHGRGLGRRMLVALETVARAIGCHTARLDSMRTLTAAISMYRSQGYVEIASYNDNPNATIWMERALD